MTHTAAPAEPLAGAAIVPAQYAEDLAALAAGDYAERVTPRDLLGWAVGAGLLALAASRGVLIAGFNHYPRA